MLLAHLHALHVHLYPVERDASVLGQGERYLVDEVLRHRVDVRAVFDAHVQFDVHAAVGRGHHHAATKPGGREYLRDAVGSGDLDQARGALEMLATGSSIGSVGSGIYECEPLQVSAMALSACGCGRDAAFGTASYAYRDAGGAASENLEQQKWLAAFVICEGVRAMQDSKIDDECWTVLGYLDTAQRSELFAEAKKIIRQGHGWNWLI